MSSGTLEFLKTSDCLQFVNWKSDGMTNMKPVLKDLLGETQSMDFQPWSDHMLNLWPKNSKNGRNNTEYF